MDWICQPSDIISSAPGKLPFIIYYPERLLGVSATAVLINSLLWSDLEKECLLRSRQEELSIVFLPPCQEDNLLFASSSPKAPLLLPGEQFRVSIST